MSYLKYSNMCAEVVRASLKEPFFTKVRLQFSPLPQIHPTRNPRLRCSRPPRPDPTSLTPTTPPLAARAQAKAREAVYMKATKFVEGQKQPSVVTEVIPAGGK
jgi:hypothetical protein